MSKPKKCISVEEAEALYSNWQSTRASALSSLFPQDPSDFVFSLSELEEFLEYVRTNSADQGIDNPGIRIYFSAYNSITSNKATVMLAPTVGAEANSANNYDIEAFNTVTGGWPPNAYNE